MRLVAAAVVVALAVPAAADAAIARFQTLSRNIACVYATVPEGGASLRCDILSGLRPQPRATCLFDWTGISLATRGRAQPTCASDTVADPKAPVLRYGRIWRRGGFTCVSRRTGLRCTNRSGHGFFLSKTRWRTL